MKQSKIVMFGAAALIFVALVFGVYNMPTAQAHGGFFSGGGSHGSTSYTRYHGVRVRISRRQARRASWREAHQSRRHSSHGSAGSTSYGSAGSTSYESIPAPPIEVVGCATCGN